VVPKSWSAKTWKREVASLMLFVWCTITLRLFIWPATNEFLAAVTGIYGILTPAVFAFAGAAFGFDAWVKQMRGPTDAAKPPTTIQAAASAIVGTRPTTPLTT
jgi:hypothetical protein